METNKVPTAEELLSSNGMDMYDEKYHRIKNMLIEFAKLHVKQALESAAENADLLLTDKKGNTKTTGGYDAYGSVATVNKKSILNSYNYDNIK